MRPHLSKIRFWERERSKVYFIEDKIKKSAPVQLVNRLNALSAKQAEASAEAYALRKDPSKIRAKANHLQELVSQHRADAEDRRQLPLFRSQIADHDRKREQLEAEVTRLQKEIKTVLLRMLTEA